MAQPNEPIDMGSFLGPGGVVPDSSTPLFSGQRAAISSSMPNAQGGFQVQTVPQVTPDSGIPAFKSGEEEQGVRPTKWDKFVSKIKETSDSSPIGFYNNYEGWASRMLEESLVEGVQKNADISKLTPEEANQQYPGLPKPFKEPVYPEVAKLRWDAHQKRQNLEEWISRGPNTGFLFGLGAGSTGAIDPFNLVAALVTGGLARGAGLATKGLAGLRNMFLQNVAVNAAGEVGNYVQRGREGESVSLGESATQVLGSAALGTGIGKLLHIGAEKIGTSSDAAIARNLKIAVAQHELGGKIDLAPQGGEAFLRNQGAVQPGTVSDPYVYTDLGHPSERSFYAAATAEAGEHVPLNDLGPGVYGTDHGQVANNLASQPESANQGKVHEFKVSEDAKFFDLETPATSQEAEALLKKVEEKTGIQLNLPEGATLKDGLTSLGHEADLRGVKLEALTDAQNVAKEMGYDGYKYVDSVGDHSDNRLVMFPGSEGEHLGEYQADKASTPQMNPEQLKDQIDRASNPEFSPLASEDVDKTLAQQSGARPADPKILDPVIAQQTEQAHKLLKSLAESDPHLAEEIQDLNHQKVKDSQEKAVTEALADCMSKGLS